MCTITFQFSPLITILYFFFNVLAPFERVNKYVIFSIYTEEVTGTDHEYEAK